MIKLPKTFEDRNGKFPEHKGKPKLSYSQYTSYKDPDYHLEYYVQYFSGINTGGNVFSEFGGFCGTKIEHNAKGLEYETPLTENCLRILKDEINYPKNCEYEDEICVDLGDFVVEGYIDQCEYTDEGVIINDFKTLNLDKKREFYASEDYGQTTLYCYDKEQRGYKILDSFVTGLGRKGTSWEGVGNYRLRLSGEIEKIPTPYSKERAEKVIKEIKETAKKISDDYKIFLKYFGN